MDAPRAKYVNFPVNLFVKYLILIHKCKKIRLSKQYI